MVGEWLDFERLVRSVEGGQLVIYICVCVCVSDIYTLTVHIESMRTVCFATERTQKGVKACQFHMFSQFYKSAP